MVSRALKADGQPPFSDQTLVDARSGVTRFIESFDGSRLVGVAAVSGDTLELVVDPGARRQGHGTVLLERLLSGRAEVAGVVPPVPRQAWAHGDHPASRRLAASHGFAPARTLLQLRRPITTAEASPATGPVGAESPAVTAVTIDSFVAGRDDEEWVALNARVFAGHPEQGRLTVADLHARMAEPWFRADDFLVARSTGANSPGDDGMVGFNWLKIDPAEPEVGEIYAIGVDSGHAGHGLGRRLMERGLARLAERGCTMAALYVEEDNSSAVPLYRSLGFTDFTVDILYQRVK
ncbi:mycothiol synthase [soil metagenome]